jgi:hypothetical protein
MTIYTDLNIIDDFEERHGIEETLRRARTFMISYLEMMTDLPEPTRHSLEVANRFSECLLTSEDLANERKVVWKRPALNRRTRAELCNNRTPDDRLRDRTSPIPVTGCTSELP